MKYVIACLLWIIPATVLAQGFPSYSNIYVNDYADVLDDAAEARITAAEQALEASHGVQVSVLTIDRRSDYGDSPSIESFAKALFNDWGIGNVDANNGILILVAVQDREMRVALGAAYPPVYDGLAQRVIDTQFLPAFRKDRYQDGIEAGLAMIIDRLAIPLAQKQAVQLSDIPDAPGQDNTEIMLVAGAFFGFLALMFLAASGVLGKIRTRLRRCPNCGRHSLSQHDEVLENATLDAEGKRRRGVTCDQCDYDDRRVSIIPVRTRSTGSGSGGSFGGGRSSGGGASGKW
ncbi:TPM domain-containing protein [Pseudogemmobacter sp. W21_MBD1_M6]|uniref:TPM domain-containing protein n=1 Tax=Pseudogemmobacter sp. W21_MBD1_M6 TaxID=3240271 RepID=UPI003F9C3984